METEPTEGSPWRSADVPPSSEGRGPTLEPFASSDGGSESALATATTAAAAATSAAEATAAVDTAKAGALSTWVPAPYSELTEGSSDTSLAGEPRWGPNFTHKIGHGSIRFEPNYVSSIMEDPYTTADLNSTSSLVPGSSSSPVPGSSSDAGCGSVPDSGFGAGPGPASGPGPGPGPELSPCTPSRFGNLTADYTCLSHSCQKQQPWEFLQVSEPGARGLWKPWEVKGKPKVFCEMLPRGQCLLHNWEEERATNHLDQVPSMQDGSESYFFRHGHQGLLTMQLPSPMPSSTTQKDSYQPPGKPYQPLRGKREAVLEMLLYHQIWVSVTSGHWTHHSGRTAASQHQCPCLWGSLCPMNLRITFSNWEKYLPLPVREEGRVVEQGERLLSKG
nr:sperm-associated antigen 8 isoform X3 [Microcebus murinus]